MSEEKKKYPPRIISPRGIAVYPKLNKPDEFKGALKYKTTLRFSASELDTPVVSKKGSEYAGKTLREVLDEGADAAFEAAKAKAKNPKDRAKVFRADPYATVYDGDDETGDVELRFACNSEYKDKKTGKMVPIKPALVDAKRSPITAAIWGGSILKVSFSLIPYFVESSKGAGVSLRLHSAQVLELVTGGGSSGGDDFDDEDGYTNDDTDDEGFGDESGGGDDAPTGAGW